jgi:RNA polymerase sigma-70 factor (ECF subfamily)
MPEPAAVPPEEFVALCARAIPEVYGFLVARCGDQALAEDLTSETFMAAVAALKAATVTEMTVGWLVVVARRRLVDHWRREEREERRLRVLADETCEVGLDSNDDVWDELDVALALAALARLGPHHRTVLTLRYLDGLPVADVASEMGRGFHATEALLQRARRALRRAYEEAKAHA